jgi:hypothetical protein
LNQVIAWGGFVQYLFRLSQRSKPIVSVEQYAPLLRAAFEELGRVPNPPQVQDPSPPEVIAYLQEQSAYWERVNARRIELEAARPDQRLKTIHEEAVKFFRASLKVLNILGESTAAAMQGNFAQMRRKEAEAESRAPVLESISGKLRNAFQVVQQQQPTLFSMLGLPSALLQEFGVQV